MNTCGTKQRKLITISEFGAHYAAASSRLGVKQVHNHMEWIALTSVTIIDERKNFVSHDP